jgi:hypothetical protein
MTRLTFGFLCTLCLSALGCGDGSGAPGGSAGSGGAGGAGGVMMFDPGPTCTAFCANVVGVCEAIDSTEASCRQGCEGNLAEERAVSEACGDAVEAVFMCAAELGCDDVDAWLTPPAEPTDDRPCDAEIDAVDAERTADQACAQIPSN